MAFTDFHNHLIPGVDDGAVDLEQARTALQAFYDAGVRTLVCTPHFDGGLVHEPAALVERLAELDAGFERLREVVDEGFPDLTLARGVEYRLDTPEPDLSEERLRLGGGPYALVEFAFFMVPPRAEGVIARIVDRGWNPILAHPERYQGMESRLESVRQWRTMGLHLQVNAGSLLGRYGTEPRKLAHELLARGWVDYVCSDYHARGDTLIPQTAALLDELVGEERRGLLMDVNPRRMLRGEAPLPVGGAEGVGSGSPLRRFVRRVFGGA